MRTFLIICILVGFWKLFGPGSRVELGPGVMVAEVPKQGSVSDPEIIDYKGYKIEPLATFEIKAKVLSKTRYSLDAAAAVVPVDLALGWQNMSDESVLAHIDISQSNRWYYWSVMSFPIPRREIETQSANMHIIPANGEVENFIDEVKQGQIIEMTGFLVKVENKETSWYMKSSLTRKDTGANACEVIYVEQARILQ